MQIERSSNRGPYVAALLVLLLLCLTIPLYWQTGGLSSLQLPSTDERWPDISIAVPTQNYAMEANRYWPSTRPHALGFGPEQTLQHLLDGVRASSDKVVVENGENDDLFTKFLTGQTPSASRQDVQPAVPGPYVTAVLTYAGREMTRWSLEPWVAAAARSIATYPEIVLQSQPTVSPPILEVPPARVAQEPVYPRLPAVAPSPVAEPAQPPERTDAYAMPWCAPSALLEQLELLATYPYAANWACEVMDQVQRLTENERLTSDEIETRLSRLSSLTAEAVALAESTRDDRLRAELLRAHWGLVRRIDCWSPMRTVTIASASENRFAARVPWDASPSALTAQGTTSVDLYSLSDNLETYEQSRSPRLAREITNQRDALSASPDAGRRAIADQIEQSYRNSNVRIALTADALSRFMPLPESEVRRVHDHIAGTPVHGRSQTFAENRVKLEPESGRLRVGLETDGTVASVTTADGGAAQLHSRATTNFIAEKSIEIAANGVRLGPTTVNTRNHSRLVGIQSDFDWIPIVGDVVRNRARDEYRAKHLRAQAEVEYKVARRVEQQIDLRTDSAFDRLEERYQEEISAPLARASVKITPIEFTTTAERLVARLRVAGDEQLGGHTPRPRAPADSLASLQLHESALSNASLCLELDGKRFTTPELQSMLREKLPRLRDEEPIEVERETTFAFADQDAVRFRIVEGRLELILAMKEVILGGRPVRDFRVHAYYRPEIHGVEADLAREGALGIEGRIRTGDRIRMHNVFNKVLDEERRLPIVQLTDPHDRRLAGLMITQLVLEDGWLGLAIGPQYVDRNAERSRMLR